jgi:hypothetical protein
MATHTIIPEKERIPSEAVEAPILPEGTYFSEVAETLIDEALGLVRMHVPALGAVSHQPTLVARPDFAGPFKCALAIRVARVLGAQCAGVCSVYHYDQEAAALRLVVLCSNPKEQNFEFVRRLDRALLDQLQFLRVPEFLGAACVLDVLAMTPKDVRLGIGGAGLLGAVRNAPVQIWTR